MVATPQAQTHLTSQLAPLIAPGVLGFYTHFEVTEIFAQLDSGSEVINVFTIAVAEERGEEFPQATKILTSKRIKLKSLKGWAFGIARYTRPISELIPALEKLNRGDGWAESGDSLGLPSLSAIPHQFTPPDATSSVPLNRVLKNNFWNGSHIFEWSDSKKLALGPLFEDSQRLQELSKEIQNYVPIALAPLSDRLGNLIVQLPVTVLMTEFQQLRESRDFCVQVAWHPRSTPRALRATCELEFDGTISGYASHPVAAPETILPMQSGPGPHQGFIWDEENQVILAATGESAFIRSISLAITPLDPEPRTFTIKQSDGVPKPFRIGLSTRPMKSLIGEEHSDDNGGWTQKRMYKEQADRLAKERRFVQYRPDVKHPEVERDKALDDLRHLIQRYGQEGAWLWDPYLSAHDILETLFFCPHYGSDLRGLTAAKEIPVEDMPVSNVIDASSTFVVRQKAELDETDSNWRGLRLEFRVRRGQYGWAFHDRFLIFPRTDAGALAWSLGTSVNGAGKAHHILQQVDDGQLVMDAFVDLWG